MLDFVGIINSSIDLVGKLRSAAEKAKDVDMRLLVTELQSMMVDLRIEALKLKEENASLKIALSKQRKSEEFVARLEFRDGVFWLAAPTPSECPGPYCPNCKAKGAMSVMHELPYGMNDIGKYYCSACQTAAGPQR
jgi:hypothetical protein